MTDSFLLFEDFISHLRRQGFVVTIEHYLRLKVIIHKFAPYKKPHELKSLLCPIFATSEKEQRQFYQEFDRFFKKKDKYEEDKIIGASDFESISKPKILVKKWNLALIVLIIACFIGGTLFLQKYYSQPVQNKIEQHTDIKDKKISDKTEQQLQEIDKLTLDSTDTAQKSPELSKKLLNFIKENKILHWIITLLPLLWFIWSEWRRYRKSNIAIQKEKSKKPPYIFPLKIEKPAPLFLKSQTFYQAARFMRQRLIGDIYRLDVSKTINKTINYDFPPFSYKPLTKPPEYLFLIDMPSGKNHFSWLADEIAKKFKTEDIFITKYFYENNPRVCFESFDKKREYLSDIKQKYPNHRLIIIGKADELIGIESGRLEEWTEIFKSWQERVILTPVKPKNWGMREVTLAKEFILLPASLNGFKSITDYFEKDEKPDLKAFRRKDIDADKNVGASGCAPLHMRDDIEDFNNIDELRSFLGDDTFLWLCACAVYPEIHWDLTLYLGSLDCMPDNLITEENLMRLISLPFFKEGKMEDALRWELISELDKHENIKKGIRFAIIDILEKEKDNIPKNSHAYSELKLNIAFQKLSIFSKEERKKKKEALKSLRQNYSRHRLIKDYTFLKFLETDSVSPLSFLLPKKFKKMFFKNGLSMFGIKTGVRAFISVILILGLFGCFHFIENFMPQIFTNSIGMKFIHVKPGTFMMGSNDGYKDEKPVHEVTFKKGFYMQTTEVTQGQWMAVMGDNPSHFKDCGENCPVENVSWDDAKDFIKKLNKMEGDKYRLPTEAEWEYAARGGEKSKGYKYSGSNDLDEVAWYRENSDDKTQPAAGKKSNELGIYDMSGNVWEWCEDKWHDNYEDAPSDGSAWVTVEGSNRVNRGGSWNDFAQDCRVAGRNFVIPEGRSGRVGFRLVLVPQFSL
jgi:formylglycine-generating enzyme required for sulfatase activity